VSWLRSATGLNQARRGPGGVSQKKARDGAPCWGLRRPRLENSQPTRQAASGPREQSDHAGAANYGLGNAFRRRTEQRGVRMIDASYMLRSKILCNNNKSISRHNGDKISQNKP